MAIFIRECVGGVTAYNITSKHKNNTIKHLKESSTSKGVYSTKIKTGSLMQRIEGIHVGSTRNFTWYTESALLSSQSSWTNPYLRPLIMHHNEEDGKIIGRVLDAEHVTTGTRSGTPALVFLCNVPDEEGIAQIKDGRLVTPSIGVIAHDARCSICGEQIEVGEDGESICGHYKGEEYNGKTCYWMIYSMEAKELSYVIVPSDIYAHNLDSWIVTDESNALPVAESIKEGGKVVKANQIREALKKGEPITTSEGLVITPTGDVSNTQEKSKGEDSKEPGKTDEGKESEEGIDTENNKEGKEGEEDGKMQDKEEGNGKEKEIEDRIKELEEAAAAEAEKTKKTILELQKIITIAQETISELSNENSSKDALIEAAEDEAVLAKKELRDYLEAEVTEMQNLVGEKVEEKSALAVQTKESLIAKAKSLKESVRNKTNITITEAHDTTIKKAKAKEDVNKASKASNVSLEEALNILYN